MHIDFIDQKPGTTGRHIQVAVFRQSHRLVKKVS
jgi:hypothetical protein